MKLLSKGVMLAPVAVLMIYLAVTSPVYAAGISWVLNWEEPCVNCCNQLYESPNPKPKITNSIWGRIYGSPSNAYKAAGSKFRFDQNQPSGYYATIYFTSEQSAYPLGETTWFKYQVRVETPGGSVKYNSGIQTKWTYTSNYYGTRSSSVTVGPLPQINSGDLLLVIWIVELSKMAQPPLYCYALGLPHMQSITEITYISTGYGWTWP